MDFMDKIQEKAKKKMTLYALIFAVPFFFLLIFVVIVVELIIGSSNNNQSTGENGAIQIGDKGENIVFKVLCQNCGDSGAEKSGIMGTEFMEKMSEMINLYNKLEIKTERNDELDFVLLSTTIGYGKKMQAEIFQNSEEFGNWIDEENLTNRDIDSFPRESDITVDNAQKFYKWASVSLGTPYALPDLNLRGLAGNLISGKVVTSCDTGSDNEEDLIKQIVEIEKKLSGEIDTDPSFWDNILSIFGIKYATDDEVLIKRLTDAFNNIDNPNNEYADLLVYLGVDNYDPEMKCSRGKPKYTYTKFMNYEQYKVYLEKVFVPQNYINCDECLYKNSSDYNKSVLAKKITREIFELAEYNRSYLGMSKIDYIDLLYGDSAEVGDLKYFSSPIKNLCTFTSGYGTRAEFQHNAVDTIINGNDKSLYAAYDGEVIRVNHSTNDTLSYNANLGYCPVSSNDKTQHPLSNGIEVIIKHNEINGTVYYSRYVHLAPNSVVVKEGDKIKKGTKIANMGNTGCSTGTHLHFELYTDSGYVDPSYLFKQCNGAEIVGKVKVTTTDNFVTPEKCMSNGLSLDEIIAGLIKKTASNAANNPEYVKSLAIVIRTKLMHETNWCNEKIDTKVDIDIYNNSTDLLLYSYVIDTQGMVLNYSGEILDNVSYSTFPCEKLPVNGWNLPGNRSWVLSTLGIADSNDLEYDYVINKINEYNRGCINYQKSGNNVTVTFGTIPKAVSKRKDISGEPYSATVQIPKSSITATSRYAQNSFSTVVANYYASTMDYTKILYEFYASKTKSTENSLEYMGEVDISTSPGLIDAKVTNLKQMSNNSQSFTYGEILPGSNTIPSGNMSDAELQKINQHIINYIDTAEQNAIAKGDINPKRARVLAAAYWLIYNPFYKVQYTWGRPLEHDNYNGIGWDPSWSSVSRIECQNFVLWSLWNAGAKSVYPSWSKLQHSDQYLNNGDKSFTVEQVLNAGVEIGDVLRRSRQGDNNGHWAIVWAVNKEQCYIEVAHAVSEQEDTKISRYNCGESFRYEHLYKLPAYYQDDAWKASVGK